MANEAKDLARRWCEEIFNEKNVAVCDEIMADRYVDHAAAPFGGSAPGEVNGPEHMRGVAAWLFGQFPDLRMEIEAIKIAHNCRGSAFCGNRVTSHRINLGD